MYFNQGVLTSLLLVPSFDLMAKDPSINMGLFYALFTYFMGPTFKQFIKIKTKDSQTCINQTYLSTSNL